MFDKTTDCLKVFWKSCLQQSCSQCLLISGVTGEQWLRHSPLRTVSQRLWLLGISQRSGKCFPSSDVAEKNSNYPNITSCCDSLLCPVREVKCHSWGRRAVPFGVLGRGGLRAPFPVPAGFVWQLFQQRVKVWCEGECREPKLQKGLVDLLHKAAGLI